MQNQKCLWNLSCKTFLKEKTKILIAFEGEKFRQTLNEAFFADIFGEPELPTQRDMLKIQAESFSQISSLSFKGILS